MKYGIIVNQFTIPEDESNDFSDMKYENGFLYMLERNGSCVSEPSKYGMAEALLLTKDEIWIGIDNNGLEASKGAEDRFGIKGNQPSILRFKRPTGF